MALLFRHQVGDFVYEVRSAGSSRRLYTNGVLHSQYSGRHPVTGSVWDLLWLPLFFDAAPRPQRILLLGVGAGATIRQLSALFGPCQIVGVEIDPIHLEIARDFFGVTPEMATLHQANALDFVQRYRGPRFDVVIDDLFTGRGAQPHRALAFDEAWLKRLRRVLTPSGTLTVNFADKAELSASCLPSAVGPSRDFPVGFELRTPATENVVAAVLSKVVQSATLRAHLRATPALASYLRNERLRYHVRPMAT